MADATEANGASRASLRIVVGSMKSLSRLVLGFGVLAFALGIGFAAGVGVIAISNLVLPPFQLADDESPRELIPVALAYLTMAGTTALVAVVTWRRVRKRWPR